MTAEAQNPYGELQSIRTNSMGIKAARIESTHPSAYRTVEYPDGQQKLQGAYVWYEGFLQGVTWKDIPIVKVNEQGVELS
jgi:hypothetical protein